MTTEPKRYAEPGLVVGCPVVVNGSFYCRARQDGNRPVVGVVLSLAGGCVVRDDGIVRFADWTAVAGAAKLTSGAAYYLGARPGTLTATKPENAIQIGVAVSDSDMSLTLEPAVWRGRQAKLATLAAWKEAKLAAGFDTNLGFAVNIDDTDQHKVAAYKVMLDLAIQAGQRTQASPVVIADINGAPYSITVAQFYQFILPYGAYCEGIFQSYQVAYAHLMAATTLEAVAAVALPT